MDGHPDHAWTIEDLVDEVYEGIDRAEKKHRVSVLRAVKKIVRGDPDWRLWQSEQRGGTLVLLNAANIMGYALGRLKADFATDYRRPNCPWAETEDQLIERLQPGGRNHDLVLPGGSWHRHVRMHIARRDGRTDELQRLEETQRATLRAQLEGRKSGH